MQDMILEFAITACCRLATPGDTHLATFHIAPATLRRQNLATVLGIKERKTECSPRSSDTNLHT